MNIFTFLTKEQVFGTNQLDIIRIYGTECVMTDFSILLGGSGTPSSKDYLIRKDKTGWWWTKTPFVNHVRVVDEDGYYWHHTYSRNGGARPAFPYSSIQSISTNLVSVFFGIKEIEYGEYPQTIVDANYSDELERAYNNRRLRVTGKKYTDESKLERLAEAKLAEMPRVGIRR